MDEEAVRARAQALCEAIVAGDIGRAIEDFSTELRQHLGEVIALLPLPASEATIELIEHSGSGDNVVLRLVGESDEVLIQTRWKDRDGKPTVIEASHLTSTAIAAAGGEEPAPLEGHRARLTGSGGSGQGTGPSVRVGGRASGATDPSRRRRVQLRLRRVPGPCCRCATKFRNLQGWLVGRLPLIGLVMGSLP